jgi:ribosomal protein S18 acetylase RimI-like enzyme
VTMLRCEIVNKQTHPDDCLELIGRAEMDMLLDMLRQLALTKKDITKIETAYLDALPEHTRLVIEALQKAVLHPANRDAILGGLSRQVHMPEAARKEWSRVVNDITEHGKAEHEALAGALKAYGDDDALAIYRKKGGALDKRIQDKGYTFFLLKDDAGKVVALASGNANQLAAGEMDDKLRKQFRLLNVAVPAENHGHGYGTQLLEHIRTYAHDNGYEDIAVPLSLHALVKENPVKYATMAERLDLEAPLMRTHPSDPLSIELGVSPHREHEHEKPLDKKYRRYAKDVLTSLINNPTAIGSAPGINLPYLRFEMSFPEDEEAPKVNGKYTDLVAGKVKVEDFFKGNEIHDMAYAVRDAVALSINDGSQQFTVEAVVHPTHRGIGTSVDYFIYSESHPTPQALQSYLSQNQQSIMTRFAEVAGLRGGLSAA